MKLVIIESPYAGDVDDNVKYARDCVKDSLKRDEAPIASHLLYTQPGILDDNIIVERAQGIAAGYAWMESADEVVFYVDKGFSSGMSQALLECIRHDYTFSLRSIYGGDLANSIIGHEVASTNK